MLHLFPGGKNRWHVVKYKEEIKKQENVLHSTHEFTRLTTTKEAKNGTEDNPDDTGLVPEQP